MEWNSGVGVALVASLAIVAGWLFLSVTAALILTLLAGAGVVVAAVLTGRRRG